MYVHVKLVPRRIRTEARFQARDPWNGNAPTEFSVESYRYVPEHVQEAGPSWRWGNSQAYAIRSEIDGIERFLPDSLGHLWTTERTPAEALPGLLHELEPGLRKSDFRPMLARKLKRNLTLYGLFLLALAIGTLFTWPWRTAPTAGGFPFLPMLLGVTALAGGLTSVLVMPLFLFRMGRRRRQIDWALARIGGSRG